MNFFPYHVPILMYHQILPHGHEHFSQHIAVEKEILKSQISQMIEQGWQFQTLNQWPQISQNGTPHKTAIITFDDISSAFIDHAAPVLEALKVKATLFPIQNMVQGKPYQNLSEKGIRPLTESQLLDLHKAGYELGSHGQSHTNFCQLPLPQVRSELTESKVWLESIVKSPVTSVCYPIGGVNRDIIQLAKELGYTVGVTTLKGTLQWSQDNFVLRRVNIKNDVVGSKLHYCVSPLYGLRRFLFRPFRAKYRIDYGHTIA